MTEQTTQTQNNDSPAAGAPASSEGATQQAGSTSSQPGTGTQVDAAQSGHDNPGPDDGGNGSREEGERSRPPRSERRISELSKQSAEWEKLAKDTAAENERLRKLVGNPINEAEVKLPDYSQMDSVTPAQIKSDVVNAADQIVKIRLGQLLPEAFAGQDLKQARSRAVDQLREVSNHNSRYYRPELDPDSESYESDTDDFLAKTFQRVFKADPSYTFRELVKSHFKQRGGREQTNTNRENGTTPPKAKSPTATRTTTGGSSQPHKPIAEMSATEYRDYLRSKK